MQHKDCDHAVLRYTLLDRLLWVCGVKAYNLLEGPVQRQYWQALYEPQHKGLARLLLYQHNYMCTIETLAYVMKKEEMMRTNELENMAESDLGGSSRSSPAIAKGRDPVMSSLLHGVILLGSRVRILTV